MGRRNRKRNKDLDSTVEEEVKKPGFFRRHWKKLSMGLGAAILAGSLTANFYYAKEGTPISIKADGNIDRSHYMNIMNKGKWITEMPQIEDLVNEVHHLNTGKDLGDGYRFTIFKQDEKPFRFRATEHLIANDIGGLNWNGDIYLHRKRFSDAIHLAFHEIGHGPRDGIIESTRNFLTWTRDREPIAEKNVIDSMVSLMYLDPEIGYNVYADFIGKKFRHDTLFNKNKNKWGVAETINFIRCAKKGDLEIKKEYPDTESIKQIIESEVKGKKTNDIIKGAYDGVLTMFTERFGKKKDFSEKFDKIKGYIEHGTTDNLYSKRGVFFGEIHDKIKEKRMYTLKNKLPNSIRANVQQSLFLDYWHLGDIKSANNAIGYMIDIKRKAGAEGSIPGWMLVRYLDQANGRGDYRTAKRTLNTIERAHSQNGLYYLRDVIESTKQYPRYGGKKGSSMNHYTGIYKPNKKPSNF